MTELDIAAYDALVWFRCDLRTLDNPALYDACEHHKKVAAVYILTPEQWREHNLSAGRLGLTFAALQALNEALAKLGVKLFLLEAPDFAASQDVLDQFLQTTGVKSVYLNAEYALDERRRDRACKQLAQARGIGWTAHHGSMMLRPGAVLTKQGDAYKVFTPFRRAWFGLWPRLGRSPRPAPRASKSIKPEPLPLLERHSRAIEADQKAGANLAAYATNEPQALAQLDAFAAERLDDYASKRDIPSIEGTSRLSACLAIGLLSPIQCLYRAMDENQGEMSEGREGPRTWISELIWRDFYMHVLYAYPQISKGLAFRAETDQLVWRHDRADFAKWCEGKTGFPIVDAAMRQLNETGWMHNRLRMVTAMFLTKYLLIDWRWGEKYFMQNLVDGHFGSNNGGWQWSASTGTDASPYFRVLSPVRQQERFDPDAEFIKRFVPELAGVSVKAIRQPGHDELILAGYPEPMVDLKFAKQRCMEAFKSLPKKQGDQ